MRYAAGNHKTEGKEAEDEGIFLRFGDDLAVDDNPHRAAGIRRKCRLKCGIIEGSRKEIADRFVQNAGTHPSRRIPAGIGQSAPRNTNPKAILITAISHPKVGNGSATAGNSDGRRVGGAGGKDLRSSPSRNSLLNGLDVYRVGGAGKQGRERDGLVGRRVGVENVAVANPRVANREIAGGSDCTITACSGRAAKNPEGLAGRVVLARINMDEQLRVRYPPPPQRQTTAANNDKLRFLLMYCFIKI